MKNDKNSDQSVQYLPIFMSIGISVGMAIGAAVGNIPVFMCMGIGIGVCIGAILDASNKKTKHNNEAGEEQDENEK